MLAGISKTILYGSWSVIILLLGTYILSLLQVHKKLGELKLYISQGYVSKGDCKAQMDDNRGAHKELWGETNKVRERVSRIEGRANGRD